jgi:DNA adenine methylase
VESKEIFRSKHGGNTAADIEGANNTPRIPFPIPYQGSKRKLASIILASFPKEFPRLYEPFAGSAAVSLAVALHLPATHLRLNDTNVALIHLWKKIIEHPAEIAEEYNDLWQAQLTHPRSFYDECRKEFNHTGRADLLLYLLARCVKASVRYNEKGEFNQSPDNRRLGSKPKRMMMHIFAASQLLNGHSTLTSLDFREAVADATADDVIYMDPPYQGVSSSKDHRYANTLSYDTFVEALLEFNHRGLSYAVSYDGRTGDRLYGKSLPKMLMLKHHEVDAGRSTQSTLTGGDARTVESLYLSPALVDRTARRQVNNATGI